MGDPHRRIGGVDVLAARARRAHGIDPKIRSRDHQINLFGLWQHGDGGGGCVHPALGFGFGHALHAVHAGFEFQAGKHALAFDVHRHVFDTAQIAVLLIHDLEGPAHRFAVALIHAQQVGCEQRRLIAARAGANFQDRGPRVGGVFGQKCQLQAGFHFRNTGAQLRQFFFGQPAHFRIGQQNLRLGHIIQSAAIGHYFIGHGFEIGIFTAKCCDFGGRGACVQTGFEKLEPLRDLGKFV